MVQLWLPKSLEEHKAPLESGPPGGTGRAGYSDSSLLFPFSFQRAAAQSLGFELHAPIVDPL